MHVKDARAFGPLPLLREKIAACDTFVAEYDLSQHIDDMEATVLLAQQPLPALIGERKYTRLSQALQRHYDVPIEQVLHLKPFFIVQYLTMQLLRSDHIEPLDVELWNIANAMGKNCTGVETLESQISFVSKMPIASQLKMLLDIGRNPRVYRRHLDRMIGLYENAEIHRLHKSLIKQSGAMRRMLLFERNFTMADRIATLAQEQTTFAAFGAGHLTGGKGVLRLLKQKGFLVKAVV